MLKILHLSAAHYPEHNGTTVRLFGTLSKLPHESILIISNRTMKGRVLEPKEEIIGNMTVKTVPLAPHGIFTKSPLRYFHTLYEKPRKLFIYSLSEGFDIIHAHNSSLFLQTAKKLSRKLNKPFIIEFHAARMDYTSDICIPGTSIGVPLSGKIIGNFLEERRIKNALRSCNHVITLTQPLKLWLANHYNIDENNITVVPNGVDSNRFAPVYGKKSQEKKTELNLRSKVVMYSGVLDKINGVDELVKVIPSIIDNNPDISFLFIGHGSEENKITDLSKKYTQVLLLPVVPYEEMPIYYQMCDLFVIPRPSNISTETIVPLKLLESMAMERPVLGSNVGGITEVIHHGENGYLFNKGDFENFVNILFEALICDNTQLGKNARKTIVDNYTWDRSANILKTIYEDLV
ncbi:glycosyltransferase family 4 protein [Methanosarcina sp. T3]|uniref:glycosyltransferase family 4 protein n=1 Tax=Methanosarcina sp. T3 TaxID=3439062 RepID=UPI003F84A7C8